MTKAKNNKKRAPKRYDLPLHRGSGGHLVSWTIGVMSYLTVLVMVLVFALTSAQSVWQAGLSGRMTIEIPYNKSNMVSADKQNDLVRELNKLSGVSARILSLEDIGALVGPWLGTGAALAELPLPVMIDITRADNNRAATPALIGETAKKTIPTAVLDTHEEWLADLMQLAKACRMVLIAISLILGFTAALTVAATSRTRLALHKEEVDLLHLIGATDSYIATQFQRQAFRLAVEGAAGGLFAALLTMAGIGMAKQGLGDTLLPGIHLSPLQWLWLVLTPLIAGVIAMVASRFTVLYALRKVP